MTGVGKVLALRRRDADVAIVDAEESVLGREALPTFFNSVTFIAGTLARMAFGFVAWLLAARLYPAAEVGLAAAIISAMMLCAQIAIFGGDSALVLEAPRHGARRRDFLDTAFSLACLTATAVALAFLVLAATVLGALRGVATSPWSATLFVVLAVLVNLWALLDQLALLARRADQILVRACLNGVVTITLVSLAFGPLGARDAPTILAAWTVASLVACAHGFRLLRRQTG